MTALTAVQLMAVDFDFTAEFPTAKGKVPMVQLDSSYKIGGSAERSALHFNVSFELLEAARYTEYLRPEGRIITNTQQINPMPVITGAATYPENLVQKMENAEIAIDAFDALALAEEAGSAKAVNLVLLGRLSKYFDFTEEEWMKAIETSVPAKFLELNKKAFRLGAQM